MDLGDYGKAKEYFKISLEINPLCWISANYCYLSGINNGWEDAISDADSLFCNISACMNDCNNLKRGAYFYLKEYKQALSYYNKSIERGYNLNIGDSVTLAFIYNQLGRKKEFAEMLNLCKKYKGGKNLCF